MKCYDCGGLIAPGADKCPACNCPAERMQAVKCLETRLLTARVEAESALDQLGRAKVAMLCAAFFALVGGVVVLVHAGGDATMRAVGIFMAALACVYAALAFLVRKAPLTLSIAGFLLSWLWVSRSGDRRGHGAESLVRRAVCPHYEPCRIVGTKNR